MKHKNRHAGGRHRHQFFAPEGQSGPAGNGRHHHGRGGGGRRGGRHRLFDYGEMRLLVLSLIGENPTYGYELIKTIEDKFAGSYTPSPGVIYPTLTWLEEAGHIRPTEESGRKTYHITPEGEAFLAANRAGLDEILARAASTDTPERGGRRNAPVPVMRAMENLKTAMRLKLRNGGLDPQEAEKIAAVLDEAARAIGQA
ncbi:PadR family transcriptional regulator [Acetobacter lambici]|uniref:PadR family transcriptional regulator n=1 Tax=Acetobacter lambici TaxID=1332824 RepID=A0ABT1F1N5_9PROT|nr:PadR family transcriptional regulator [Acetobacter lambici]MCP1242951.1 PadR family transcriptional regulator [Acetobacter lambici]MCP1259118.1 PadR family transcriptional regulator [Acetobacter lambici]NHO57482.1 PadR family transcriptional regulator [Acetobacter lambici]